VVDTYRAAWAKMVKDPDFIKRGSAQFSADFTPLTGQVQGDIVKKTAYPKPQVLAYMQSIKKKYDLPTEPLSDEQLAALAKAKGFDKMGAPAVKAKLTAVGDGGRDISFSANGKDTKIDVSSSRTHVTIKGQKAARADLKPGMDCSIEYLEGAKEANGIACE